MHILISFAHKHALLFSIKLADLTGVIFPFFQ